MARPNDVPKLGALTYALVRSSSNFCCCRQTHCAAGLQDKTFDLTTFATPPGATQMVVLQHIPVKSMCSHHLLPFVGMAVVAYLPGERICGNEYF